MKSKGSIKRFTVYAIVYLVAALASYFAGYYANPIHKNTARTEETVWETAYVTEWDYTSAESAGDVDDNYRGRN